MLSSTYLSQGLCVVGGSPDGLGFKLFHEQVSCIGTKGHCTMDLFIILTLEEKVGAFQAEFQQCGDMLYAHGCPAL